MTQDPKQCSDVVDWLGVGRKYISSEYHQRTSVVICILLFWRYSCHMWSSRKQSIHCSSIECLWYNAVMHGFSFQRSPVVLSILPTISCFLKACTHTQTHTSTERISLCYHFPEHCVMDDVFLSARRWSLSMQICTSPEQRTLRETTSLTLMSLGWSSPITHSSVVNMSWGPV